MLTRKHFEAIAAIIRREHEGNQEELDQMPAHITDTCDYDLLEGSRQACDRIMWDLVELFKDENPSFDSDRFIEACQLDLRRYPPRG